MSKKYMRSFILMWVVLLVVCWWSAAHADDSKFVLLIQHYSIETKEPVDEPTRLVPREMTFDECFQGLIVLSRDKSVPDTDTPQGTYAVYRCMNSRELRVD